MRRKIKRKFFAHESAYVDNGAKIGEGTYIWHFTHIMKGAKIGKKCKIGQNVVIAGSAVLGNNVMVQNNVSIYDGVILEDYVFCGPSMVFTNIINPRSAYPRNTMDDYHNTIVKKGASIGANSTVICGNTIGKNAFVGAGSVITKDIPDYALVYGNPAKVRGWMCACGEKLEFVKEKAQCKKCKKRYEKNKDKVKEVKS